MACLLLLYYENIIRIATGEENHCDGGDGDGEDGDDEGYPAYSHQSYSHQVGI